MNKWALRGACALQLTSGVIFVWNGESMMTFSQVLQHVKMSIHAEQVFCSIVTEMKFMPSFQEDPELATVHKENYETSYHRNTAAGNLRRLLADGGPSTEQLILMTVECFLEARQHDRTAEAALQNIQPKAPEDQSWLNAAAKWHGRRKAELHRATKLLRASIPDSMWEKGKAMME
jgi:hypothetical protein